MATTELNFILYYKWQRTPTRTTETNIHIIFLVVVVVVTDPLQADYDKYIFSRSYLLPHS